MEKIKVLTVVGTRPEIIRLSRVMSVLDEVTEHVIVHTGQNYDYELNEIFFDELGITRPAIFLDAAAETAAETIGNVIARSDAVFKAERPDAMLVLGDTNSALSVIAAKRLKIPVFHMEAGNRCFDMRVPEEINRRIVDHVSDFNLTYSEHARRYLIAEGLPQDRIIKTGSPMKEVLDHHAAAISASDVHDRLGLARGAYFTVSMHREENVDDEVHLDSLVDALNGVAERYDQPLVFSAHPRTSKRLEARGLNLDPRIRVMPPLGFIDYVALQKDSRCTLSDSGTITEESSILGFPAITIRQAHERPEGMDEGVLVMSGIRKERVLQAIELTLSQFERFGPCRIPDDYDVDQVSWKVAKIILSHIDFVNQKIWLKRLDT
ncbi:UDP-N-acetylglucosamine 2-epimerase (non-hydrolyzing) [bacterium]|nr:UDP-N-acetylglucosamine 2-epimerase (non-hydrolyzing) [bacterium]MBU1072169.1 UDP-N-acetylglucosamine 2-epimerase (non-hydrolyzing) [bacterium]MBU1675879.1 UDP-N-acetylglucosamine 2-epimerase (non-hydrolyzing) [bacterium]